MAYSIRSLPIRSPSATVLKAATNVTLNGTTLTFSIYPFAKEEKAEDLVLLGTVKLAAGAMKNAWGTDSGELAFSRSYAPSNIGKAISLDTIKEIYEASSGYIDTATSVIGGISSVVEIGVTISELMGWKENTDSILDDVRGELQELDSKVTELAEYIRAQASNANFEKEKAKVDNIKTMLNYLLAQNEIFFNLVANYTIQIALENGQVEVYDRNGKPTGEFLPIHSEYTEGILKLEYAIDAKCVEIRFESTGDRFTKTKKATHYIGKPQFMEKLAKLNSPAVMDALAQQAMKLAAEQMKDDLVNGSSFDSYLSTLCKEIMDKDILAHYNTMLSYMYNFETQAQTDKMGFIAYLSDICTMSVIMTSCILDAQNPNNPTAVLTRVDTMNKNMQNLKAYLAKYKVTERPDGSIFMYVYGEAGGYVKNVICQLPLTRYHDFDGFAFLSDTQIKDFMRRLNGRSVQEELKNAGFTMESFTRSFDYYDKLSCMDNWAYSKPYTETKGDGFFTKDKNYTYAKTLPCTSKDPESVTVEICYDSSLFWTLFTDGVYENIVALYWLEKAG